MSLDCPRWERKSFSIGRGCSLLQNKIILFLMIISKILTSLSVIMCGDDTSYPTMRN